MRRCQSNGLTGVAICHLTSECQLARLQELLNGFDHRDLALIFCHFQTSGGVLDCASSLHFKIHVMIIGTSTRHVGGAKGSISCFLIGSKGNITVLRLYGCSPIMAHDIEILIEKIILVIHAFIVKGYRHIPLWSWRDTASLEVACRNRTSFSAL